MLSPHYTPSTEDDESYASLECDLFPSQCTPLGDMINPVEPGHVHDEIVFDQYLCSPSPSPSLSPPLPPEDAASEWSGATLIGAVHDQYTGSVELSRVESRSPILNTRRRTVKLDIENTLAT